VRLKLEASFIVSEFLHESVVETGNQDALCLGFYSDFRCKIGQHRD